MTWLGNNVWWLCGLLLGVVIPLVMCGPRFLLGWLRDSARTGRHRLAAMPARTRRTRRRRVGEARAQAAERCDLTADEVLEFRRITGRIANGQLADTEGKR